MLGTLFKGSLGCARCLLLFHQKFLPDDPACGRVRTYSQGRVKFPTGGISISWVSPRAPAGKQQGQADPVKGRSRR